MEGWKQYKQELGVYLLQAEVRCVNDHILSVSGR